MKLALSTIPMSGTVTSTVISKLPNLFNKTKQSVNRSESVQWTSELFKKTSANDFIPLR